MAYATAADFIQHFGQREATMVSDRAKAGEPDDVELNRLLAVASEEADGYVGRRYALPLTALAGGAPVVPQPLRLVVLNIARYHSTGTEIMNTDEIRDRYKSAIRWLEGVAKGEIQLGVSLTPAPAGGIASAGGATSVRTGGRLFGGDVLGKVL